jgi:hypothetical protein
VFAYKVYQAILKKLSDYGYPVPEGVSFGHRELMRLVGRTSTGGKNSKELAGKAKRRRRARDSRVSGVKSLCELARER